MEEEDPLVTRAKEAVKEKLRELLLPFGVEPEEKDFAYLTDSGSPYVKTPRVRFALNTRDAPWILQAKVSCFNCSGFDGMQWRDTPDLATLGRRLYGNYICPTCVEAQEARKEAAEKEQRRQRKEARRLPIPWSPK